MRQTKIIATVGPASDSDAIVAITRREKTAKRLSVLRPRVPILAMTHRDDMARSLALHWGVLPVCTDVLERNDPAGTLIGRQLVDRGLVAEGSLVVLVSISPDLGRADANYLEIQRL